MPAAPEILTTLIGRFDPSAFDAPNGRARLRLAVDGDGDWDFVVNGSAHALEPAEERLRPAARLCADRATWARVARDLRGGMNAFRGGRLRIRDDLHLGVGFLAATSGSTDPGRLELARVRTALGDIAIARAGDPQVYPVVMLHGLGGTKGRSCRPSSRWPKRESLFVWGARTGSSRSASRGTSARRCLPLSTSSSTPGTCRRGRRMRRCGGSWRRRRGGLRRTTTAH